MKFDYEFDIKISGSHRLTPSTTPGICDPIDSAYCKSRNAEFGEMCEVDKFKCDSIEDPGTKLNISLVTQL